MEIVNSTLLAFPSSCFSPELWHIWYQVPVVTHQLTIPSGLPLSSLFQICAGYHVCPAPHGGWKTSERSRECYPCRHLQTSIAAWQTGEQSYRCSHHPITGVARAGVCTCTCPMKSNLAWQWRWLVLLLSRWANKPGGETCTYANFYRSYCWCREKETWNKSGWRQVMSELEPVEPAVVGLPVYQEGKCLCSKSMELFMIWISSERRTNCKNYLWIVFLSFFFFFLNVCQFNSQTKAKLKSSLMIRKTITVKHLVRKTVALRWKLKGTY